MNSLIIFACVLAAAVATAPAGYNIKVHHPHGYSSISNGLHHGQNSYALNSYANNGYAQNNYAHNYAHTGYTTQHREVDPVAIAAGAPLPYGDAPDVAAAKSAHLHAHAAATARHHAAAAAAPPSAEDHYSHESYDARPVAYNGYAHSGALFHAEPRIVDPVAIAAGAPLPVGDTAEVAHAKALHFKAHAARANLIRYRRGVHAVAYNAPLVHAAHPTVHTVHKAVYNAPLFAAAHPVGHHHATSHTSVTIGGHAYHY